MQKQLDLTSHSTGKSDRYFFKKGMFETRTQISQSNQTQRSACISGESFRKLQACLVLINAVDLIQLASLVKALKLQATFKSLQSKLAIQSQYTHVAGCGPRGTQNQYRSVLSYCHPVKIINLKLKLEQEERNVR